VAERIVDVLEVVEIDHHQSHASTMPSGAGQHFIKSTVQHESVRQACERVVVGKTVNILEGQYSFGDVFDQR
jgi:hypothetical protein